VADLDPPAVAALVERFLRAPTNGVHLGVGMLLVDGNEFRTKTQAHDGNANLLVSGHEMFPLEATRPAYGAQCRTGTCGIACRLVARRRKGKRSALVLAVSHSDDPIANRKRSKAM